MIKPIKKVPPLSDGIKKKLRKVKKNTTLKFSRPIK